MSAEIASTAGVTQAPAIGAGLWLLISGTRAFAGASWRRFSYSFSCCFRATPSCAACRDPAALQRQAAGDRNLTAHRTRISAYLITITIMNVAVGLDDSTCHVALRIG